MPADFNTLDTEVGELTSVADSAVALMDGFDQRLQDAIAADNLSDNTNVARLSAEFSAQKTKLADAVTRNTPAAPTA
ncbi:MAG TPA: hypothetical protein VL866_24550 [Pyrinomonadaceae bacterium]|nr:hypothetical protein [Pyrinomonadaceae bacterium]